jgi:alpha-tubulin suppressor-like RCC1 family protein
LSDGTYSDCTVRVTDSAGNVSDALDVREFRVAIPPVLAVVTLVPTPTSDNTPDYTFSSNEAGTITYGGACGSSSSSSASSGSNTVRLTQPDNSTPLNDGTYGNCTIAVTDNTSNTSDNLSVRGLDKFGNITDNFTIGTTEPVLVQITPVPTLTNDNTPDYTFFSTLPGEINYSGNCDSDNETAVGEDNNTTVTFKKLSGGGLDEGPHSNCKISVTTSDNETSDNLSVNSFVIDTIAPVLDNVTNVRNPINSLTPNYTFSSDEAVDNITYGGSCSSNNNTASVGNNTITFNTLVDGITYDNCTITLTDNATNASSTLAVNTFTVDVTDPVLDYVTGGRVPTPTSDNTPDYTFNSTEAGAITYENCDSDNDSAVGNADNTITFNALSDGTHNNCTITVTDNATNESSAHAVEGKEKPTAAYPSGRTQDNFTIGATKPALLEITPVSLQTKDTTPDYTFFSTLSGTINYGGSSCSSSNDNRSVTGEDNNTITFRKPSGGDLDEATYTSDNCTLSVTTSGGEVSDNLSVSSFVVDTTTPTLSIVTIASNNDNTTMAKIGDRITLLITSAEPIQTPSVKIDNQTAEVSEISSGTSWRAYDDMTSINSEGSVSLSIDFSDLADNDGSTVTSTTDSSAVQFDKTSPTVSQTTAVPTTTSDNTSSYTFYSTEAGAITYGGSCSSSDNNTTTEADNITTVTFNALADNTYSNCTITVTDSAGNTQTITVDSFTIDTTAPSLNELTAVTTPTSNNTPDYTFYSSEAGTITYGGACGSSSSSSASSGSNTVRLTQPDNSTPLDDVTYDNCTITVTDSVNNASDNLPVSEFTIGATKPALAQVTAVLPNPTNDPTPNYTFISTLSGTISYGGSCSSTTSATAGDNEITFNTLADETYDNCTIRVTSNTVPSDELSVDNFTIDTIAPTLNQVTAVSTPDNDSTPNYTFSSTEAGTITYPGDCSSSDTSATVGNNTITFNTLADANHGNCTIRVTDNASNSSNTLTASSFIIDTTGPTLVEVTAVLPNPTNNNRPNYTFSSTEAGTITYGGGCSSATDNATPINNAIRFNALADNTYSNCTITVADNLSNTSTLPVSSFTIDTIAPTLAEDTAVTTPSNVTTPSYIFSSSEAGTISYGGSCSSSTTSADNGTNSITFNSLSSANYSNCMITVTDNASNASDNLTVSSFTIDTINPTVIDNATSPTDNDSSVSVSDNISVTFSESMNNSTITTRTSTDNTNCTGSFQVSSSDSFSSCVQMGSSPSSSDNLTFSVTPSLKMYYSKTYKIRITTAALDSAGNSLASQYTQTYGFKTTSTIPITAGSAHSCYMLDNGSVKCWGKNNLGQLGLGHTSNRGDNSTDMGDNLTIVDLGTGRTATAIEAGDNHTCAILDNASVKCWGGNAFGQLGLGHTSTRGGGSGEMGDYLTIVDLDTGRTTAIAAGNSHTCAILDNSSVKCWGGNAFGQLGLGHTSNRGDGSNQMGDNLTTVDLGTGRTALGITAGGSHTCALLDNFSVKCWGYNFSGQLGQGLTDNETRGDESGEMGDSLTAINLGSGRTATSVTTGSKHSCALLDDHSVKCWGEGENGQLGQEKGSDDKVPPGLSITIGTNRTATAITAGDAHTCAILDNSSIKCWGLNDSGQLGQGHTRNLGDNADEINPLTVVDLGAGRTVGGIAAGDAHTCAVLDNSSVKCWGGNAFGQLGLGHTSNRGDDSGQMGDSLPVIGL